jgi:acetyl-CoA C-acetyltransferase
VTPFITGWAHGQFGKLPGETLESLIVGVGAAAIEDAGLDPADIDEIYLGTFNAGLVPLAFASSLALQISPALRHVPATRVENACASGSAAVLQGVKALQAGSARNVLVIGAEKMTHAPSDAVGRALLGADYESAGSESVTGFAGLFARTAAIYEERYGPVGGPLAMIAAKSHRNGALNPFAHLRKPLTEEFCRTVSDRNPVVAAPLRRSDCSPVSDGAAALVLSAQSSRNARHAPVRMMGMAQANDYLPWSERDPLAFAGSVQAWTRALSAAGVSRDDLDLVEVHDCFTIAELIMYEVIGLTRRGEGRRAIEEGIVDRDGALPVNVSGGLKSKGHPVGATGVSQHVMASMQLTGTAGDMQLPNARRAAVHNMGGLAVANYVSVLEAI